MKRKEIARLLAKISNEVSKYDIDCELNIKMVSRWYGNLSALQWVYGDVRCRKIGGEYFIKLGEKAYRVSDDFEHVSRW